jgi:hypothetical protein
MNIVMDQHTMNPRTSLSHPLLIATLPVGTGAVGVTFCPGKQGDSVFGAHWARDVDLDLDLIQAWGATAVVTLVEASWPAVALHLRRLVADGNRVLVHCRGGLGRAGTVAACLLVELGVAPQDAVLRVRAARPHAIETAAQERYVLGYRPRPA